MSLSIGSRIGPYEVTTAIGAGGMGEVYRARDAKLGRDVALKILPEAFAADPERLQRFEREARTLASLSHPNIAGIYGFEESAHALVMEFVEGEDLAARLARGAVPVDDALEMAKQMAEALEAAHEQGIIHRDLKPANIKVRPDGVVKILDFGLAKALDAGRGFGAGGSVGPEGAAQTRQSPAMMPTMTSPAMTAMGVIIGTAAYMSPEQARGRVVDRRADLWAFGVVLFEMLTGKQTFGGESITDVLAAVVKEEPDWASLPASVPAPVRRLLRRCLEKDAKRRLRDAADARLEIEDALSSKPDDAGASATRQAAAPPSKGRRGLLAAGLLGAIAIGGVAAWWAKPVPEAPLRRFSIPTPDKLRAIEAVISPDGSAVAFVTAGKAWVRRFDQADAREIQGSSGARNLFWSPDSAQIGFQTKGYLWRIGADGGSPSQIGPVSREFSAAAGAAWLSGDRIWYTTGGSGLLEVSAQGGPSKALVDPDPATEIDFHEASPLPDGRGVLFVPHPIKGGISVLEVFDGRERRRVFESGQGLRQPAYSPTGHVLFVRGQGVWAVPFSLSALATTGEPFLVAADAARPSVSSDGTLVVVPEGASNDQQLTWVDRQGRVTGSLGRGGISLRTPRLSPDGRFVAAVLSGANAEIYVFDVARGTDRRLTFETDADLFPMWSPDSQFIVYQCGRDVCSRRADGTGDRVVLVGDGSHPALSHDGKSLLFTRNQAKTGDDYFIVALDPRGLSAPVTETPRVFVAGERLQRQLDVSPDGRFAVYESNEMGETSVFLTTFPSGEGKWQISRDGGTHPRWSRSGDRVFFQNADDIHEVTVDRGPTPVLGSSASLVSGPAIGARISAYGFDRSLDGSRFLVVRPTSGVTDAGEVLVVEQWIRAHLKR